MSGQYIPDSHTNQRAPGPSRKDLIVNVAEMKTTSSYCDSVPNEQTCVEAMMNSIQSCMNITRMMIICATSQTMMLDFCFFLGSVLLFFVTLVL